MSLLLDLGLTLAPLFFRHGVHHLGDMVAAAYPSDAV